MSNIKPLKRFLLSCLMTLMMTAVILTVFFSRNTFAWLSQEIGGRVSYDMGVVRLDVIDGAGFGFEIDNILFKASTLWRNEWEPGETPDNDEDFDNRVVTAFVQIQNMSNVPVKLGVDIVTLGDRKNYGLSYFYYFAKQGESIDPLLEQGKFKEYLDANSIDVAGKFPSKLAIPEVGPVFFEIGDNQAVEVDTNEIYDFYWVFWIDHNEALEQNPALQPTKDDTNYLSLESIYDGTLKTDYGVEVRAIAVQDTVLDQPTPPDPAPIP